MIITIIRDHKAEGGAPRIVGMATVCQLLRSRNKWGCSCYRKNGEREKEGMRDRQTAANRQEL